MTARLAIDLLVVLGLLMVLGALYFDDIRVGLRAVREWLNS